MAKYKGIKWAQFLTLIRAIAKTLVDGYATKEELQDAAKNWSTKIEGSTLIVPSSSSINGSTLVLPV